MPAIPLARALSAAHTVVPKEAGGSFAGTPPSARSTASRVQFSVRRSGKLLPFPHALPWKRAPLCSGARPGRRAGESGLYKRT
eukprot:6177997-Pleurochrysis_carterae.AAC.3